MQHLKDFIRIKRPARYQVAADTEYLMLLKAHGETEPPERQKSLSE